MGRLLEVRSLVHSNRGAALLIGALALSISLFDLAMDGRPAYTQERPKVAEEHVRSLVALEDAFAAIAESVEPAVVQIRTEAQRPKFRGGGQENEEGDENENPLGDMFRFPFGPMPPRGGGGMGSGVIVKIEGNTAYILTNGHVVDAGPPGPLARLGDSDRVRVGQWAVAIGSPFGLTSTFTVGVISALGRAQTIQGTPYTNFLQTDAAIN